MSKHFEELFTPRWLGTNLPLDTICATLEDYFQDYGRLVEDNFKYVIQEARLSVIRRYVTAMLNRRVVLKTYEECQAAADQAHKESQQLLKVFQSVSSDAENEEHFTLLVMFGEILKSEGDMLSFDLHRLVEKYPDITEDQLARLMYLRGDVPRSDMKEKILYVLKTTKPKSMQQSSILKEIFKK